MSAPESREPLVAPSPAVLEKGGRPAAAASDRVRPEPAADGSGASGSAPAAVRRPAGRAASVRPLQPRRAVVSVRRISPFSAFKVAFVLSLFLLVIFVVAIAALYAVLDGLGVFTAINDLLKTVTSTDSGSGGWQAAFSPTWIIGGAAAIGLVNALIVTLLAPIAAMLYNLAGDITGGLTVTLSERD